MKGYWESDQLSFFSGNGKTYGWKATLERYQKKYQGEGKEMGKLAFEELSVEMLGRRACPRPRALPPAIGERDRRPASLR